MTEADLADDAVHWFMLRQSGEMTNADHAAFDRWMMDHPEASAAYHQVRHAWSVTGPLIEDADIGRSRTFEARRYRHRRYRGAAVAGLSALAAGLLLAVMPSGMVRWPVSGEMASSRLLTTGPNHRALARLPDGSVVTLDVDTRLRVAEMGERRRVLLLAGHAFFRVAKDARHPFTVTASDKTVRAIGTAFDVRLNDGSVAVTLIEGKVRIDQPRGLLRSSRSADLTPGRQLVANADRPWTTRRVDTAQATSWLEDRLVYLPDTLGKVVADVNAGSARKIVFSGPIDADTKIIGVFQRGDIESVITVLEMDGVAHVVARRADHVEMAGGSAPSSR